MSYDQAVAAAADASARIALDEVSTAQPRIRLSGAEHHVVVVAAPAGAGKTYLVCTATDELVTATAGRPGSVIVCSPTNEQVFDLLRSLSPRLGPGVQIAYLHSKQVAVPPDVAALGNVTSTTDSQGLPALRAPVVVGTASKVGDAHARARLPIRFDYLILDEAWQAQSSHYYSIAGLADRHLLVGDPGQLDPFSTMPDPARWRGMSEDPVTSAVDAVLARWPNEVVVERLPITRRLPASAVPVVASFYPDHALGSWTVAGARRFVPGAGTASSIDATVDAMAQHGWAQLKLPARPAPPEDPEVMESAVEVVARLVGRGATLTCERHPQGRALEHGHVAVAASHRSQVAAIRQRLDALGLATVKVDTANKLQGLEFEVTVAVHPLAGQLSADAFHLDPGRLCVMLSRHRHGCIVVGREGVRDVLGPVPPPGQLWPNGASDGVVDGWYAHQGVLDALEPFSVAV